MMDRGRLWRTNVPVTRRRVVGGLAGLATGATTTAVLAQFGFSFGGSQEEESGVTIGGVNVGNVISGLSSLIKGLTMGEKDEIRIAEQLYPRFIDRTGGAYPNQRAQISLRNFAEDIFKTTKRPQLPWEITLLNDNAVNAWVLPGGKVGVNKGVLRYVADEAELAAVLGHEMGHAELSHGLAQMRSENFMKGVTKLGKEAIAREVGQDRAVTDGLINALEGPLLQMVTSGYAIDHEFEADQHLLEVFANTGHDPAKAANFFETLLDIIPPEEEGTTSLYSSHPGTLKRIERIRHAAAGLPSPERPALARGFASLKQTFPTRKYFGRHG